MYSKEVETLLSEGSQLYAAKDFDNASEKYAEACESFNKENEKDDADLLLLYGKSLFQGAVSKSEVFGAQPVGKGEEQDQDEGETEGKSEENENDGNFQFCDDAPLAEEEEEADGAIQAEEDDEDNEHNEDEGEDEQEDNEGNQEQENEGEDQNDFEFAWEILDLTRSLYESQLAELEPETALPTPYLKSDNEATSNEYIILTKKLSETYDLLGEVSLESENFSQSAIDLEKCLNLRKKLYDSSTSSLISESHYKLSLALEFCVEDPSSKSKAVEHLKEAIKLVQGRNKNEKDEKKKKDNEELMQDLLVKLDELEREAEPDIDEEKLDILKGILGQATSSDGGAGSSKALGAVNDLTSAIKKTKKVASPQVNDLSSMVKKRKPAAKGSSNPAKKPKN